ncbi:hypothetical protein PA25_13270 [Pseudoalteromonas sp. A25]|uniref:hypothetical protein n=1 Tax=Pseudoalteromonas sp. A25 TaxID=116092 RepID=UPI001260D0EB|nr:hypothetical protein [Pseudoalteromonas sp. A25]BBN81342.1 hypothetical protein PA25_13270 [Pseudoalteromonas sp. A25]
MKEEASIKQTTDSSLILEFSEEKELFKLEEFSLFLQLFTQTVRLSEDASILRYQSEEEGQVVSNLVDIYRGKIFGADKTEKNEVLRILFYLKSFLKYSIDLKLLYSKYAETDDYGVWTELLIPLRGRRYHDQSYKSDNEIQSISYNSPLKIKFKNTTMTLVAAVVFCGGEVDISSGKAKLNGVADTIIKLKREFVSESIKSQIQSDQEMAKNHWDSCFEKLTAHLDEPENDTE